MAVTHVVVQDEAQTVCDTSCFKYYKKNKIKKNKALRLSRPLGP